MTNVKVLDGGFSGQLSRHVGDKIYGDPLWTARFLATNPDAIYKTHLDFLRAGADVIETNTYQATVSGLKEHMSISLDESLDLLAKAVSLAKKAVDVYVEETTDVRKGKRSRPMVAGSCGPYGAYLHDASEYTGFYGTVVPQRQLIDWHRSRARALLDAGVDLLAFETIPCVEEADALVKLLRELPDARAWLSFSCLDGQRLSDENKFQEVATHCYRALPRQIVAIGVNCVAPEYVTPLLKGINEKSSSQNFIPLVAYPNRGGSYTVSGGWTPVPDDQHVNLPVAEWLDLGVRYIGGCCKVFAEDIKTIRSEVDRYCDKRL